MTTTVKAILATTACALALANQDPAGLLREALDQPTVFSAEDISLGEAIDKIIAETGVGVSIGPRALEQLPYEQREVVTLRMEADMTFRQIAALQQASINTVQGRYRYGLAKLRSLLNGEVHS